MVCVWWNWLTLTMGIGSFILAKQIAWKMSGAPFQLLAVWSIYNFFYPFLGSDRTSNTHELTHHYCKNQKHWAPGKKWSAAQQNQQNDICTQWRLRSVWSESSLSAWRNLGPLLLATYWAHNEDCDQTGQICLPRLIWVFAGRRDHFISFIMLRLKWFYL